MKVLYLGGFELPDKNAAAQRVISNAMLLREMGFEVSLIGVNKEDNEKFFDYNGFSCRCLKYPRGVRAWLYHIFSFIPIAEIKQYSPQYIVLYNFPAIASLKILHYSHKYGIKVFHDLTEWEKTVGYTPRCIVKRIDTSLRMRYCMNKMDGVIAISKFLYNYYCHKVKTILVPPTVDINSPKWNRNRNLSVSNPISLVYAGSPGGGIKDRLDLIVEVIRKYNNIKLIVVGIDEKQFYESFNKSNYPLPNVEFMGRLPHKEAVNTVCNSDFQMLIRDHNRKNDAGFPTKLAESMTCGTPVIATEFSNITDYIKDGENGFLINGEKTISNILDMVSSMSQEEILKMKHNCIDMVDFNYKHYKSEFGKLFS